MILTKRDSLEKFIRQQMEGPGACNDHFTRLDIDSSDVNEEVINTTPGSLYSTAILFPQRKLAQQIPSDTTSNTSDDSDLESDSSYQESQDDNSSEELDERVDRLGADEEDLYSLSQRFPTTIGISCCLDKNGEQLLPSDLAISISGRYYTKILTSECCDIVIKIGDNSFQSFFEKYHAQLDTFFSISEGGIHLVKDITKDISTVKDTLLSINKEVCKLVATNPDGTIDNEYEQIGDNYRYLKSYKERLWRKLKTKDTYLNDKDRLYVEDKIKNVECNETYLSYLEDAMNICNNKSFGYWQSHSFTNTIDLNGIDFNKCGNKVIFSPREYKNLNIYFDDSDKEKSNFSRKLSIWLQVTRLAYGSSNKIYLKTQLENSSTPFEESPDHYFSIVTEKVNERCFFGVQIKIESPLLAPYQERSNNRQDDIEHLNYLYRSINDYAVGHLCSVDWKITDSEKWVSTEFIPSYETPDVEPIPRDKFSYVEENGIKTPRPILQDTRALEFKWLSVFSDATDEEIITQLKVFADNYKDWIDKQKHVLDLDSGNNQIGYENLDKCLADYKRIEENIMLILKGNATNMMCFRLMNSAMFIQLWHSKRTTNKETDFNFYKEIADDHLFGDMPAAWRPFQLAFILINLDGIIQRKNDPEWKCRNELVDLVWFPTGGGKTEAYLGIIALSIIHRRIQYPEMGGGTTAIMRYTLRLLATQQFQRAMRLILALEQIRRWGIFHLGDEPISIGLYVGEDSLPNDAKRLSDECQKWNTRDVSTGKRRESKIPLDKCPCCGSPLKYQNMGTMSDPKIVFRCDNINCIFSDIIPVELCDEYIYQNPPTLLFGTVDKFAALGHKVSTTKEKQDSRRLFGKGVLNNLPPSLIIQDELHLLLGPLGSAVSLFECAIDQLCSYLNENGTLIRPKIISSTATTRNTELQIRALYDRDVSIFPKPGTDYDDSFFSFYRRKEVDGEIKYISKRKYIGIFPTGRTHMTTQMRTVATLFVHRAVFEKQYSSRLSDKNVKEAMDYYHSIIDYFNSLKEVGKTDAQFYTEFTKYTRRLFKRVLRYSDKLECLYGYDSSFSKSELTGRLTGAEVVNELEKVGKHWDPEERYPHQHINTDGGQEFINGTTPPDLILATNMISVGLDVDRFNTIIMNSMPRNIAEYIQASSRVARNKPGLVITLHNPFRARDLSHFERFREFHEKLYYYVEPISITPFSKKSVSKYLPLYNAALIRHHYANLANAENAASLSPQMQQTIKNDMFVYFRNRLQRTQDPNLPNELRELLTEELEKYIELFIEESLNNWQGLVDKQQQQEYSLRYSGSEFLNNNGRQRVKWKDLFLALDAYLDDETENMWAVPMSLRTVESEAVLNIKDY